MDGAARKGARGQGGERRENAPSRRGREGFADAGGRGVGAADALRARPSRFKIQAKKS